MATERSALTLNLVDLPDVILVRVMSFLNLNDRYSLMQTCQRFCDIFQHPSLWYCLKVDGLKTTYAERRKHLLERYSRMIESVGHCCQELEFRFQGNYEKMDDDVRAFVLNLSEKCRLETLVVSFDYANSKRKPRANFIGPALREDINALCSIVSRCHRLSSFCIQKWPVFNHTVPSHNEILEALCENEKLVELEKLHLFWPDRSEATWASVKPNQTPEYALKLVDHFKNLTHLSLMSYVLSEELVKSLAQPGRTRLQNLRVMVVYKSDLAVPSISDSTWSRLSPHLRAEIVFSARIPYDAMFELLRPAVPVFKIHFMPFSRCSQDDLSRIANLYASTLEKFVDETDSINSRELLKLVHVCDRLRTLVYRGKINYANVIELAKIRGNDWYYFSIPESSIDFQEELAGSFEDDEVLRKNEHGEYYQVALHNRSDTEESLAQKAERRADMVDKVTQALGYKWEPQQ